MSKYFQVFLISFRQEFAYRLNFIMWRIRNVIQIVIVFFLWDTVFAGPNSNIFGYDRSKILTYVFGLIIVRAFVLSARAVDVGGEVSSGDLNNYLVKPISYFKYWLTRDLSSKALNIVFAIFETLILFLLLKPPFYLQTNPFLILAFLLSSFLAMLIFFYFLFITSAVPFWSPESTWGAQFLLINVFVEFLSGALFPLDILPAIAQKILNYTPFPYLIFFPVEVYLGKITGPALVSGLAVSFIWVFILAVVMKNIWGRGFKVYEAYGR